MSLLQQQSTPLRIALYSHDTMGIGHLRRNLLIADILAGGRQPTTSLVIAGAREACRFSTRPGVDCLTLPALHKTAEGDYQPRSLGVSYDRLIQMRSRAIDAALEAFQPDVLVVDKVPRGAGQELDPTLERLSGEGQTRCVLGLRDVLDHPDVVRREWEADGNDDVVASYYDAVWVYGDRAVYDTVSEYSFAPHVAKKVAFTGLFDPRVRYQAADPEQTPSLHESLKLNGRDYNLCVVGGGQDGAALVRAFIGADKPDDTVSVVVLGPFIPADVRRDAQSHVARDPSLRVLDFVDRPEELIAGAARVVAMGGYNTICEILAYDRPALIVPRQQPREEQFIRAAHLQRLGLIDMLPAESLSSWEIAAWLAASPRAQPSLRFQVDLGAHHRLPQLLNDVLTNKATSEIASEAAEEDPRFVEQ